MDMPSEEIIEVKDNVGLLMIQVLIAVYLWCYIAHRIEELTRLEKNNVNRKYLRKR